MPNDFGKYCGVAELVDASAFDADGERNPYEFKPHPRSHKKFLRKLSKMLDFLFLMCYNEDT